MGWIRRTLRIGAILLGSIGSGIYLWLRICYPCLLGKATLTLGIDAEKDSCLLVDLRNLSRNTPGILGYSGDIRFLRDQTTGDVVLHLLSRTPVWDRPDWFRIRFAPPGVEHFVPDSPDHYQPFETRSAYDANGTRLKGWPQRVNGKPLEGPSLAVFHEGGHRYECPGTYALFASELPGREFLVLTTAKGDTYMSIYRRRDRKRVLKFTAERCFATTDVAMVEVVWVSKTGFAMVTGSSYSNLLVCRFRK